MEKSKKAGEQNRELEKALKRIEGLKRNEQNVKKLASEFSPSFPTELRRAVLAFVFFETLERSEKSEYDRCRDNLDILCGHVDPNDLFRDFEYLVEWDFATRSSACGAFMSNFFRMFPHVLTDENIRTALDVLVANSTYDEDEDPDRNRSLTNTRSNPVLGCVHALHLAGRLDDSDVEKILENDNLLVKLCSRSDIMRDFATSSGVSERIFFFLEKEAKKASEKASTDEMELLTADLLRLLPHIEPRLRSNTERLISRISTSFPPQSQSSLLYSFDTAAETLRPEIVEGHIRTLVERGSEPSCGSAASFVALSEFFNEAFAKNSRRKIDLRAKDVHICGEFFKMGFDAVEKNDDSLLLLPFLDFPQTTKHQVERVLDRALAVASMPEKTVENLVSKGIETDTARLCAEAIAKRFMERGSKPMSPGDKLSAAKRFMSVDRAVSYVEVFAKNPNLVFSEETCEQYFDGIPGTTLVEAFSNVFEKVRENGEGEGSEKCLFPLFASFSLLAEKTGRFSEATVAAANALVEEMFEALLASNPDESLLPAETRIFLAKISEEIREETKETNEETGGESECGSNDLLATLGPCLTPRINSLPADRALARILERLEERLEKDFSPSDIPFVLSPVGAEILFGGSGVSRHLGAAQKHFSEFILKKIRDGEAARSEVETLASSHLWGHVVRMLVSSGTPESELVNAVASCGVDETNDIPAL